MTLINKNSKSPLLAFIKFEPTFSQVLWRFAFPLPLPAYAPLRSGRQGEAGGRGVRSLALPPAEPVNEIGSPACRQAGIFSNTHRQLENLPFDSPATRARQPILGAKLNFFLCLATAGLAKSGLPSFLIGLLSFYLVKL